MEQADDVMASDDTSMTSVVSDGAVVTSRLLIPLLEEKVIGNPTIQKVLLTHQSSSVSRCSSHCSLRSLRLLI